MKNEMTEKTPEKQIYVGQLKPSSFWQILPPETDRTRTHGIEKIPEEFMDREGRPLREHF